MRTKKKILVVDDDLDVQTTLKTILGKNYEVETASNSAEGLEKVRSGHPDLAILDVVMDTKYEGFEVAKTMAGDKQLDDIPILMLTSIDILTTSRTDMHAMVREFRKSPNFEGLDVLLVKNQVSGTTAVDYVNEKGENVFFNVAGFLPKPIDSAHILPEIKRILGN